MRKITTLILVLLSTFIFSQTIEIEFPKFAGKTYEFIIFQGDKSVKLYDKDTIPKSGLIKLEIPKEYAPYSGMCRWLITGTKEGGGLDMAIPGYSFKVSCLSDLPNEKNIIYTGFDAVNELNRLHKEQQTIIDKYETISKAVKLYTPQHKLHRILSKEKEKQRKVFIQFSKDLKKNKNYNACFLPILNLTKGISDKLTDDYDEKAKFVNDYIVNELNYNHLYTSGHWTGIIQSWVQIHAQLYNDKERFVNDFRYINSRISDVKIYTDWVGKVTYFLTKFSKDEFIDAIAPLVINSGKITSYEGKTMQVYQKSLIGMQAADLIITQHIGKLEDNIHKNSILKYKDLSNEIYDKFLLIFYQSGCGSCEELMQKLPEKYQSLKEKRIKIITISGDESEQNFNISSTYPWEDKYCDFQGITGINFKNYAVIATPTMFLIDKNGIIEKKITSLDEIK